MSISSALPGTSPNLRISAETVAVTIWGGAEGAITIVAASIPVLRTLIQSTRGLTPDERSPGDEGRGAPVRFNASGSSQISALPEKMQLGSHSSYTYSVKGP